VTGSKEANDLAGKILLKRVKAAKRAKKRFDESGKEVWRYGYSTDYNFEYQNMSNASFKAKVAKTTEAIQIMVPMLMPPNPNRLAAPRAWSTPESMARSERRSAYVNYTVKKTDLSTHSRQVGTDAVIYGRGVAWTGMHPRKGLVCTEWDSVRNLLVDPNAKTWDQVAWIGRERYRPKFEVMDEVKGIPGAAEIVREARSTSKRASDAEAKYDWEQRDTNADCIHYYEIYTRVGIHNDQGGLDWLRAMAKGTGLPTDDKTMAEAALELEESPRKYLITDDGRVIADMDWEIPFFHPKMDSWPCSVLDFYPNPESIWPVSPLESGLGYQRAMNYLATVMMGRIKFSFRTLMAVVKQNRNGLSDDDKFKILEGPDINAMELDIQGDTAKIGDYLQQFDWKNDYIAAAIQAFSFFETLFEKATGLYAILYSGEGQTQSRTAQDASIKDRNSRNRIEDLRDQVARFHSDIARKETFAAGFLLTPETIQPLMGDQAAMEWGTLVPDGATTPEGLMMLYLQNGMDVNAAMERAIQVAPFAYTIDDLAEESDCDIEVSSARRHDLDQQIDAMKELWNQNGTVMLQSMDPIEKAEGYHQLAAYNKLLGLTEAANRLTGLAQHFEQMAMMPMGPPGAPPPGDPTLA